jgi:hypothetical protein
MNMQTFTASVATVVSALVLFPSVASAEDARITCTGTVTSILGSGLEAPFSNAAVGETVQIVFDVEIAEQLPFNFFGYPANTPTSSVSIGAASDGFAFTGTERLNLRDNFDLFGDIFAIGGRLSSAPSTQLLVYLRDPSESAFATQDIRNFYGTSLDLSDFDVVSHVLSPTGQILFDVLSVEVEAAPGAPIGVPYCTATPNSTGSIGTTSAFGLQSPGFNDLTLTASGLPNNQSFGYFIVSSTQGFIPGAGGSQGNLCVGGAIGRFVGEGQVIPSDFAGEIALPVDLTALPSPTGSVAVQPGQTWNFQLWLRDGTATNFTRGLSVTFQ